MARKHHLVQVLYRFSLVCLYIIILVYCISRLYIFDLICPLVKNLKSGKPAEE